MPLVHSPHLTVGFFVGVLIVNTMAKKLSDFSSTSLHCLAENLYVDALRIYQYLGSEPSIVKLDAADELLISDLKPYHKMMK